MKDFGILPDFAGIAVTDRYGNYFHATWKNISGHQVSGVILDGHDGEFGWACPVTGKAPPAGSAGPCGARVVVVAARLSRSAVRAGDGRGDQGDVGVVREPSTRARWTGMAGWPRLAAMRRMPASEPVQLSRWPSRAVTADSQSIQA